MCNDTLPNASALAISLSVLMSARDFRNFQITPFSGFKMSIRLAERCTNTTECTGRNTDCIDEWRNSNQYSFP